MKYYTSKPEASYRVAILIKEASIDLAQINTNYIKPIHKLTKEEVMILPLKYDGKTPSAKLKSACVKTTVKLLETFGVQQVIIADTHYYKAFTGVVATKGYGYINPIKDTSIEAVVAPNYGSFIYNPLIKEKLDLTVKLLNGNTLIGQDVIHKKYYPDTPREIRDTLKGLLQYPTLFVDIEAFSLKYWLAGIGTIGFSIDEHNGIAFAVDYDENGRVDNQEVKKILRDFFIEYTGKLVFHGGNYDLKPLIFELFMDRNHTNYEGLHQGLDVLCRDIDDTMIITYLCVNSTARNELGLKPLTYEYMGDYAEDVKDITTVPLADLLEYNLKDCLATAWLYKKNYPRMIKEKQLQVYEMVKQPDIESICHTEMTGMCLDIDEVKKANKELSEFKEATLTTLYTNQLVIDFNKVLRKTAWEKDFADRKAKAKKPENIKPKELNRFDELIFNPNSGKQVATLLHEVLNLPVLSTTDKGAPSTGNKVLKKLLKDANEELSELLNCLIDITDVSIILNNFLKAMLYDSVLHEDGYYYLHGNFKTTGTVSGRLSSSNVNLQNLPSHSKYSKVIKKCFIAPKGWIFSGADSNSLEDMISALVTKDPNKLKVYTDHYDGHALRSHSYFPDEMPDITKALIEADDEILGNFYEVTLDDGTKQYLRENSKEFKQYKQGD